MRDPSSLAPREIELTAELLGALDSELRLRILLLLYSGDHVVHQMVAALDKSQPLISQHLRVLKSAGLVTARRAGREVVYSLAKPAVIDVILEVAGLAATGELDRKRGAKAAKDAAKKAGTDAPMASSGSPAGAAPSAPTALPRTGGAYIEPSVQFRPEFDPGSIFRD